LLNKRPLKVQIRQVKNIIEEKQLTVQKEEAMKKQEVKYHGRGHPPFIINM